MICTLTVSAQKIENVWKLLTEQRAYAQPLGERPSREMAQAGWVETYQIEDALSDMDRRLSHTWLSDMPKIAVDLGLCAETNFFREWKYADEIYGSDSLSASDALRYFWWLERLGFPLDTGPLCDQIIETLPRTRRLARSYLDVLLYKTERYSQPPIELMVEQAEDLDAVRTETVTAENGVVVEIRYDRHDQPISLTSTAPNYAEPKDRILTTCAVCGQTYVQGSRGDEDQHAISHRKTVEPLDPSPSRAWKAWVGQDPESVWVDEESPNWMHVAMYRRARAFKREFEYDHVQWNDQADANDRGIAFAFLDDAHRMIGGCSFQIGGGADGRNRMMWIWFCPGARRQGHLSRAWSRLRARMGNFDLEPPVSRAMQAFMTSGDESR